MELVSGVRRVLYPNFARIKYADEKAFRWESVKMKSDTCDRYPCDPHSYGQCEDDLTQCEIYAYIPDEPQLLITSVKHIIANSLFCSFSMLIGGMVMNDRAGGLW